MSRPTIQKNSLTNTALFNILPSNQAFILGLLDKAIGETTVNGAAVMLTLIKFGQKSPQPLVVEELADLHHVVAVSAHLADSVRAQTDQIDLSRPRPALQLNVGDNFQSKIDRGQADEGASVIWKTILRRGTVRAARLNFVQAYTYSPHTHINLKWKHPVSGAVVTVGDLHPETNKALVSRAYEYLRLVGDLHAKFKI